MALWQFTPAGTLLLRQEVAFCPPCSFLVIVMGNCIRSTLVIKAWNCKWQPQWNDSNGWIKCRQEKIMRPLGNPSYRPEAMMIKCLKMHRYFHQTSSGCWFHHRSVDLFQLASKKFLNWAVIFTGIGPSKLSYSSFDMCCSLNRWWWWEVHSYRWPTQEAKKIAL